MDAHGRISIRELQSKPVDLKATQKDPWVGELLQRAAPPENVIGVSRAHWVAQSELRTEVRIEKVASDYMVTGSLSGRVLSTCSRCADPFPIVRSTDFRLFLVPKNSGTEEEASDDPDYVFFEGESISLPEILAEQLIVLEGVAECPRRKGDGSCSFCGKNPKFQQAESGQGTKTLAASLTSDQLEKLKALKL